MHPLLGTWPATQAPALTGNRSGDTLICRLDSIHWATPVRTAFRFCCCWLPQLCQNFLFDVVPFFSFCPKRYIRKNIAKCLRFLLPIVSSSLTFKSSIHFELMLMYGIRQSSLIFLHVSNFSWHHYWVNYLYPIVCSCILCHRLIDHIDVGLLWVLYSFSIAIVAIGNSMILRCQLPCVRSKTTGLGTHHLQ